MRNNVGQQQGEERKCSRKGCDGDKRRGIGGEREEEYGNICGQEEGAVENRIWGPSLRFVQKEFCFELAESVDIRKLRELGSE